MTDSLPPNICLSKTFIHLKTSSPLLFTISTTLSYPLTPAIELDHYGTILLGSGDGHQDKYSGQMSKTMWSWSGVTLEWRVVDNKSGCHKK